MPLLLTVRLTAEALGNYPEGIIVLGAPLHIVAQTEPLLPGDYDSSAGWYDFAAEPAEPALVQLDRNRYAFCGQVQDIFTQIVEAANYHFIHLDCSLPIGLIAVELEPGSMRPFRPGDWLHGFAALSFTWADDPICPWLHSLSATVTDIERLSLRLGPGFGQRFSPDDLPLPLLGPDQVLLTLAVAS